MKRLLSILLVLTLMLCVFVSCGKKDKRTPEEILRENVLGRIAAYDMGNGYTYSYEQKLGDTIIHSKVLTLQVRENQYSWTVNTKDLNSSFSDKQFTESSNSGSFSNGVFVEGTTRQENVEWNQVNPVQFERLIEQIQLDTLQITSEESGHSVRATLNTVEGISGICLEAKISSDFSSLLLLKVSYSQSQTTTTYLFTR